MAATGGTGWELRRRVRLSGGEVAYDTFGSGAAVVLVHGTPTSSLLWREVAAALATSFEVYVFDLLGFGSSQRRRNMFEGFEHNPYEAEARERYGDEAVDESCARMKGWSAADAAKARTGYGRVHEGLAPLLDAGVPADDDRVQELIDLHYEVTSLFWTPDAEAYRGLAQLYVDDERFTTNIGQGNDALVAYLRNAMVTYADARLS